MILRLVFTILIGYLLRGLKKPVDEIFASERSSYLVRVTLGMATILSVMQLFLDQLDGKSRREATTAAVLASVFTGAGVVLGDMWQSWIGRKNEDNL